jgi:hypothetical protein
MDPLDTFLFELFMFITALSCLALLIGIPLILLGVLS